MTHHIVHRTVQGGKIVGGAPCDLTGFAPDRCIQQALLAGPSWRTLIRQITGRCMVKPSVRIFSKATVLHIFSSAQCLHQIRERTSEQRNLDKCAQHY